MILNETEMNLEGSNLQGLGVHMFSEGNQNIDLNVIFALRNYTTITIKCTIYLATTLGQQPLVFAVC